jgi:hypothetical protein
VVTASGMDRVRSLHRRHEPDKRDLPEPKRFPRIRLAFIWRRDHWDALPWKAESSGEMKALNASYPANVTLWAQGSLQAPISATRFSEWEYYSEIGAYAVNAQLGAKALQAVGPGEFPGWDSEFLYRPVVLATEKSSFPAGWLTPVKLDGRQQALVVQAFAKEVPTYDRCTELEGKSTPAHWRKTDVRYRRVLRAGAATLVAGALNQKLNICRYPDGYLNDQGEVTCQFCTHWFLLEGKSGAQYLGAGLSVIAHGDYNADGKDEWIFWQDGYNLNGYVLFYDDFKKRVKYIWTYH